MFRHELRVESIFHLEKCPSDNFLRTISDHVHIPARWGRVSDVVRVEAYEIPIGWALFTFHLQKVYITLTDWYVTMVLKNETFNYGENAIFGLFSTSKIVLRRAEILPLTREILPHRYRNIWFFSIM